MASKIIETTPSRTLSSWVEISSEIGIPIFMSIVKVFHFFILVLYNFFHFFLFHLPNFSSGVTHVEER